MTVAQVIQAVDAVKPNAFSNEEKTRWLNEVEGMVQTAVSYTHLTLPTT